MKYIIPHPLSEAGMLKEPLVASDITWEQYLNILRAEAVKHHRQFELAVDQLTKWVQDDFDLSAQAAINEEYLEKLRAGVKQGERVGLRSNPLTKSTVRKTFTDIRLLHNWVQAADKKPQQLLRPLVDARSINRFIFYNSLTAQTQKAIIIFEQSATRPPYDKQLMTGQTRKGAIDTVLLILRRLEVKGLEQITPEHITALTANPDPNNPEYRRISRSLHHASCLFRFCKRKGLLQDNPLENVDNSSFANYAIRDFLPPDQLENILDIHGFKTNISVDFKNELSVRDWLVVLLLVDLALRRSELASLTWCNLQHNRNGNGYSVRLGPENQKMGKPTIVLPILYPSTNELLKRYAQIRGITIGQHISAPLINDDRNLPASSGKIDAIVKGLAVKLGLQTYHQGVLSCHDLRRTFATCNAWPLGLGFQVHQLAERLRDGIGVVEKCYMVQNPLLQEAKMQPYMDKLKPKDTDESILGKIQELEQIAKNDRAVIQLLKDRVTQRIQAKTESMALKHTPDWVSEEDGTLILRQRWNHLPIKRAFREFMQAKQAIKHFGKHGAVHYDAVFLKELVEQYEPVADHIDLQDRSLQPLLRDYRLESIGYLKLIKQTELVAFLKTIRNRDRKLASVKTSKGYLSKLAKVKNEVQASKLQYASIA